MRLSGRVGRVRERSSLVCPGLSRFVGVNRNGPKRRPPISGRRGSEKILLRRFFHQDPDFFPFSTKITLAITNKTANLLYAAAQTSDFLFVRGRYKYVPSFVHMTVANTSDRYVLSRSFCICSSTQHRFATAIFLQKIAVKDR